MKTKTIKKRCAAFMQQWIDSVKDERVKKAINDGAFITGGSIASMFLREDVNDFDVYFKTKETLKTVVEYYAKLNFSSEWVTPNNFDINTTPDLEIVMLDGDEWKDVENFERYDGDHQDTGFSRQIINMKGDRIKLFMYPGVRKFEIPEGEEMKFHPVYFTPNAITFTNQLQIVIRFFGDPAEVHKNYDFVHATNYYDHSKNELVIHHEATLSLLTKDLQYVGSLYPLTSILRAKKFVQRGWKITAGEMLKIMYQISKLDLDDIDVLEEQLVGVDVAYFGNLIKALRNMKSKNPAFSYDQGYLFTLIENIFNDDHEFDQ